MAGTAACKSRTPTPSPNAEPSPVPAASPPSPDAGAPSPPAPKDVAAPPAGAQRLESGVASVVLQPGSGSNKPTATDYVEVSYSGWTRDGVLFESTWDERERRDMAEIIPGLAQALAQMVEGEKRRVWIPAALAYATRLTHVNAPRGDMTYDVQLFKVIVPPPVPPDVRGPPKSAKDVTRSKSGLVYRVLKKGEGAAPSGPKTRVQIRYALWTAAGKLGETSYLHEDGAVTGTIDRLPAGFQEGLQRMTEGTVARLWLPGKLAYGELEPKREPTPFDRPRGPVVIDVELVKIMPANSAPDGGG
ncbi:MAG TPA: FKBP-type peptidyl-prolyl cis-trans isomerase [Polyangia bacterium]